MGMRMVVLRLWVEVEGEGAWEPGAMADDDDGSGGGMATSRPSMRKRYTRLNGRGKSTE